MDLEHSSRSSPIPFRSSYEQAHVGRVHDEVATADGRVAQSERGDTIRLYMRRRARVHRMYCFADGGIRGNRLFRVVQALHCHGA